MSKHKKSTGRPSTGLNSQQQSQLPDTPKTPTAENAQLKIHPCEAAGFVRGLDCEAISIVSDAPLRKPQARDRKTPETTWKPAQTPKEATPPSDEVLSRRILNGVEFVEVRRRGGITIVSDTPFRSPSENTYRTKLFPSGLWRRFHRRPGGKPDIVVRKGRLRGRQVFLLELQSNRAEYWIGDETDLEWANFIEGSDPLTIAIDREDIRDLMHDAFLDGLIVEGWPKPNTKKVVPIVEIIRRLKQKRDLYLHKQRGTIVSSQWNKYRKEWVETPIRPGLITSIYGAAAVLAGRVLGKNERPPKRYDGLFPDVMWQ